MNFAPMAAALLAAVCTPAWAINKCTGAHGRVSFQDAPCAADVAGKTVKIWTDKAPVEHADRVQAMQLQCEAMLRNVPAWKDKDSVKFSAIYRGKVTSIRLDDENRFSEVPAVQYLTMVNAKNSFGAYTGDKPAICYANSTESKILRIKTF